MTAVSNLFFVDRLLVVLFEGHDLCCSYVTRRSVLEICEIGEQGVLVAGHFMLVLSCLIF
jgi:hypothetical protein